MNKIILGLNDCIFDNLHQFNCKQQIFNKIDITIFENYFTQGATKIVLFPKKENFVIKIPYCYFQYLNPQYPWDFCKIENQIYELAKQNNIEFAFLQNTLIDFKYPIYSQPLVTLAKNKSYVNQEEIEKTYEYLSNNNLACFEIKWITYFIKYYGINSFLRLYHFLEQMNLLSDLHEENLGYVNDLPVIFDYSGYWENYMEGCTSG
jgi:hypothetical protein